MRNPGRLEDPAQRLAAGGGWRPPAPAHGLAEIPHPGDEAGDLGLGGYRLKTGCWDMPAACSHPPLAFYLHSLPVFFYTAD